MIPKHRIVLGCAVAPLVVAGCATVNPRPDFGRAATHIGEATGTEAAYLPSDDEIIARKVDELLLDGITVHESAQICLLNSGTIQAAFMDIGMARADVLQAGLLLNPLLGIALRLPSGGGLANLEAGLAQNIADLWQIPVRKRAAQRSLDRMILDVARLATSLAADAKTAYYDAVAADERHRLAQESLALAQKLLELTLARQEAGAATELDVNLSQSLALDAELGIETARLLTAEARRTLATILGLTTDADGLALPDSFPDVPSDTPNPETLIETAKSWRLDIRAAKQAVHAAEARVQEEYRRVFPTIELGVSFERGERGRSDGGRDILADSARSSIGGGGLTAPSVQPRSERQRNTDFIIGPSLNLELPLFDQNQAQIAKADYARQQAIKTLDTLDRAVTQEVRSAVDQALTAWKLVRIYSDRSIPLAQRNLDLSREAYQIGRASFLTVLKAQRFFLETRNGYVRASQAAATTIPALERTVGLPFPRLLTEVAQPEPDVQTKQDNEGVGP